MPASRTTIASRLTSAARKAAACAGVPAPGSAPSWAKRALTSGCTRIRPTSACIFSRTAGGVFAGASSTNQAEKSYPGTPDSAIVGNSGASAERFAVLTASARSLPVFTGCADDRIGAIIHCTWPPIRSVTAGAEPLSATWTARVPDWLVGIAPATWRVVALPDEAYGVPPGRAFIGATSSPTVFAGTSGCTTRTLGRSATRATGTRSPRVSYGSFVYRLGVTASSRSTRVGRPSRTSTSPSTATRSTSRPWPVCTRLPSRSTRHQVRPAEVEGDEVRALADLEAADLGVEPQRARPAQGRHVEHARRLPGVVDAAGLHARSGERPAHQLDPVAVLRVGGERDVDAGGRELRGRRHTPGRRVALGDVDRVRAGPRHPGDVVVVQVDAVPGPQPRPEQAGVLEHAGGAAAGARPHPLDLDGALAEVRVDAQAERRGGLGDLAQEGLGAGVGRMGADVGHDARVVAPALVERERAVGRAPADRRIEAPLAVRDTGEVDVVHPPARREAHAQLGHRLGGHVGVHEVVADQRGAGQQHLERAQARAAVASVPLGMPAVYDGAQPRSAATPRTIVRIAWLCTLTKPGVSTRPGNASTCVARKHGGAAVSSEAMRPCATPSTASRSCGRRGSAVRMSTPPTSRSSRSTCGSPQARCRRPLRVSRNRSSGWTESGRTEDSLWLTKSIQYRAPRQRRRKTG
jgi:hypothetical protein